MDSIEANDLLLFARVVNEGSISRAGERLGLPKSTVSRRLAALETQLGERLLLRTTRKLTVTDFGHGVLEHARLVADEVDAATALVQHRQATPRGRLRVSMPGDLATGVLDRLLGDFIVRYPEITLELDLTPRRVDLIGENIDLALRMGALDEDSSLVAHRVATFSHGLYAAPAYLRERGVPPEPEALMEHDTLHILSRTGELRPWHLTRGESHWEGLPPVRARANSPAMLMRLASAGAGIADVNDHFAEPLVRSGELMPVLPDWSLPSQPAWAVVPGRRLMPARTRVFLEALEAEFTGPRCQAAREQLKASRDGRARDPQAEEAAPTGH